MTYEECKADLLAYCQAQGVDGQFGEKTRDGKTLVYFDLTVKGTTYDTGYFAGNERHNLNKIHDIRERVILFNCKLKRGLHKKFSTDTDPTVLAGLNEAAIEAKAAIASRHTEQVILNENTADDPVCV